MLAAASAVADQDPLEAPSVADSAPEAAVTVQSEQTAAQGSAFIRQDHRGVVDRLIQDEQDRYARENMKPEPEPDVRPSNESTADSTEFNLLHSGPVPFYQPQRRQEPQYVGLFGRPGHYRVEIYYQGSMMDYGVGDRIPGGYRLTGVRSQYITATPVSEDGDLSEQRPEGTVKRFYLTSRHAVDREAERPTGSESSAYSDLPPGLLR